MRVLWEQAEGPELEILVRGRLEDKRTMEVLQLLQGLAESERELGSRIFLHRDGREFLWETSEIPYFETQGGRVYAGGAEGGGMAARFKLYELAKMLERQGFIQINKGTLVNIRFVEAVEAGFSGNYTAFLKDGTTRLEISRTYVKGFRAYVMEGRWND